MTNPNFKKPGNEKIKFPNFPKKSLKPKTHTILLIDDEYANLDSLRKILEEDYNVLTALSGNEALKLIRDPNWNQEIQVIITDQRMPYMTGIEFLQKSIPYLPKAKRIILTGYTDVKDIVIAINELQIFYYILKPFDTDEMQIIIKRAIDQYELEDKLHSSLKIFEKFFPKQFLDLLNKNFHTQIQLGDQIQQEMTVLFADIRSFTFISENLTPVDTFRFINDYLRTVGPSVRKNNGFIDKYIGDGIMALFPRSADDALRSAVEMQKKIQEFNKERALENKEPIRTGIGIHSGLLILGIIGEEERLEGTVISNAVNLAARIEQLTKFYNCSILISEETFTLLSKPVNFRYRILDHARVKGKKDLVLVVQIFDGEPEDTIEKYMNTKLEFEQGVINYFMDNFQKAYELFTDVLSKNSGDIAAQMYVKRCTQAIKSGVAENLEIVEEYSK